MPEAKFKTKLGIPAAVVSLLLIGWLLMDERVRTEGMPILIAIVIGLVLYAGFRIFKRDAD